MNNVFLIIAFTLLSSCQNFNSNSADESRFSESPIPESGSNDPNDPAYQSYVKLVKSYNIIKTRCFQCHSQWQNLNSNQKWIDSGLVFKNNPESSSLINRLKNFDPPGDMPSGANSAIPNDDYLTLVDWIESMP
jgi:hypothetical protein